MNCGEKMRRDPILLVIAGGVGGAEAEAHTPFRVLPEDDIPLVLLLFIESDNDDGDGT